MFPFKKSPALTDRNPHINDIWRKLATQPVEFTRKLWSLLEHRLRRSEPLNTTTSKSPQSSRRTSSKVKIVDSSFLALIGAAKEVCCQIDAQILIDCLPKALRYVLF